MASPFHERAPESVSKASSDATNVKKGKNNAQKSFFLQFLSQNTSEAIKKKFHQNFESKEKLDLDEQTASENLTNSEDNLDSYESENEDNLYDKSTSDDEQVKESRPIEVVDITVSSSSSSSSSPILKSKKFNNKQSVNGNLTRPNFSYEKPLCSVSVNELFPDLDNVDSSVVEMLPISMKEKVYEALKNRTKENTDENGIAIISEVTPPSTSENRSQQTQNIISSVANGEKYTFCRECNRKILSVNFTEHGDYHYAMELRKQQIMEAKSSLVSASRKREVSKFSPTKSKTNKKRKNPEPNHNFKKIDNYFKKK